MPTPLFSVIIPTYNRPEFLAEAVGSVVSQSVADFECIVVDDASPTPVTVDSDPRVRVVRLAANGGVAAARNAGVVEAQGRYLAFLDDDDLWTPDRLRLAVEGLERAPITVCWTRVDTEPERGTRGRMLEGDVSGTIRDAITPLLSVTALDKSVWVPLDERFHGAAEVEWWLRVTERATVSTVPELGCIVRRHDGVRNRNDASARIESLDLMRSLHADYFARHRRADAFHLLRTGLVALGAGDRRRARDALRRSFFRRPAAKTLYHLTRATVPRSSRPPGSELTRSPS